MTEETSRRLFEFGGAFDHPVTQGIVIAVVAALIVGGLAVFVAGRSSKIAEKMRIELRNRYLSWLFLVPLMIGPVLLGAFWGILATLLLSLLCFGEFARATGLSRERLVCCTAVIGILCVYFAVLDKWYEFFAAMAPLTVCAIAAVTIFQDRPAGYIRRVATAAFGFLFFGTCLGHLGYMMNIADGRPFVLWLLLTVELNDIFAFLCGKLFGRRKLVPNTSPGKTIGGAVGSLALTAMLAGGIGYFLFEGPMRHPLLLLALGALVSVAGQLGDLMLSSVKRDLGVKDLGVSLPGHGGVLDRFDSLVLTAPVVFQVCSAFEAWRFEDVSRIFTGG